MEKKAVSKAVVKKKAAVEPKEIKPTSPWTEVATDVAVPPVKAGGSTSPARPTKSKKSKSVSEAVATEPVKKTFAKEAKSVREAVTTGVVKKAAVKKTPVKKIIKTKTPTLDVTAAIASAEPQVALTPVFKALAEPTLPELPRENRARLMMQTPTSLYFYWSVRENPFQLLRKMFGDDMGSYTLVVKLTELNSGTEKIHRAEAEGDWWFDVEPGSRYEAEIGFYAPNRPYFRVIYSNTIETPRRSPSPRQANDADWRVPAHKFAEVLEVAGFSQDAFDVAMAGDDYEAAEQVTRTAFKSFIGTNGFDLHGIAAEDIRYSMMALASGLKIDDLRSRISAALFAILQSNAERIAAANAMIALTEYFDIDESEFTEHKYGSAVYGASLINFPRTLTTRRVAPVSSHSFR